MLRRCVTSGMLSISDFSFCLPDNAYSKQTFKCIHIIIRDSRGWQSKSSLWTLKINPKARLLRGQIPHAISKAVYRTPYTHLSTFMTRMLPGHKLPRLRLAGSRCLKSLCRPWHKEHSTQRRCILLTTMKGGNRIFATVFCLACQNSFVCKLRNGGCQHRPRNRAM